MGFLPTTESADEGLPAYERAFASRPAVYAAWRSLVGAIAASDLAQDDVDALQRHGLSEQEVLDVILTAAARCFFSTVLDATDTRADPALQRLGPGLVAALTSGRPAT